MRSAAVAVGLSALLAGCAALPPEPGPGTKKEAQALRMSPACETSRLIPRLFLQDATGKLVGAITLRVVGGRPCSVFPAPPRVIFSGTSEKVRVHVLEPSTLSRARMPSALRALRRDDRVVVDLSWSNWCGPPPRALVITLRFTGTFRLPLQETPPCDAEGEPSRLGVGPLVPVRP